MDNNRPKESCWTFVIVDRIWLPSFTFCLLTFYAARFQFFIFYFFIVSSLFFSLFIYYVNFRLLEFSVVIENREEEEEKCVLWATGVMNPIHNFINNWIHSFCRFSLSLSLSLFLSIESCFQIIRCLIGIIFHPFLLTSVFSLPSFLTNCFHISPKGRTEAVQ